MDALLGPQRLPFRSSSVRCGGYGVLLPSLWVCPGSRTRAASRCPADTTTILRAAPPRALLRGGAVLSGRAGGSACLARGLKWRLDIALGSHWWIRWRMMWGGGVRSRGVWGGAAGCARSSSSWHGARMPLVSRVGLLLLVAGAVLPASLCSRGGTALVWPSLLGVWRGGWLGWAFFMDLAGVWRAVVYVAVVWDLLVALLGFFWAPRHLRAPCGVVAGALLVAAHGRGWLLLFHGLCGHRGWPCHAWCSLAALVAGVVGLGHFGLCGMLLALRGSGAVVGRVLLGDTQLGRSSLERALVAVALVRVARVCSVCLSSVCVLFPDGRLARGSDFMASAAPSARSNSS